MAANPRAAIARMRLRVDFIITSLQKLLLIATFVALPLGHTEYKEHFLGHQGSDARESWFFPAEPFEGEGDDAESDPIERERFSQMRDQTSIRSDSCAIRADRHRRIDNKRGE
jgi:hypothetical protein